MRPSGITDGILSAVDAHSLLSDSFNEAVGYYRRNHYEALAIGMEEEAASMRPSGITDGIVVVLGCDGDEFCPASMRPSGITDGISTQTGSWRSRGLKVLQ